jgi:hypothetical protein
VSALTLCPYCGQTHYEDDADEAGGCKAAREAGHLDPYEVVQLDDQRARETTRAYRQTKGRRS